jgi:hypothetical protein
MYEDHPEFKKKKKDGREKKSKRSRSRSHKRKHSPRERKRKDNSGSSNSRPRDMNSQERRAMIEQWNQEEEKQEGMGNPYQQPPNLHADLLPPPMYDQLSFLPAPSHYQPPGQGALNLGHIVQPQYQLQPQQFYYNEERAKNSGH